MDHIPEIETPGCKPPDALARNEMLRQQFSLVPPTGEYRFEPEVNPAAALFHQSVFSVHAAVRISCAATEQATDGLPTWSISTAYHASMLALRALVGLCGIAYMETEGTNLLMDALPAAKKGERKRRRPVLSGSVNEVQLIKVERMEHKHWWLLFQRLLRSSANLFDRWTYPIDSELARCNASVLSRHRNELHYRGAWYYDDLFDNLVFDSFGQFDTEACDEVVGRLQEESGSDGILILNQILLGINIAMLRDLAVDSQRVKPEVDVIDSTIRRFTNGIISTWFQH